MNAATASSGAATNSAPVPDYFIRAIPEPVRLLGLRLLPLSLGRYRLLKRFDVAFVADGEAQASISDLLLGVLICSMRVDNFLGFVDQPNFNQEMKAWSRRLFPSVWLCALPWFGRWWRRTHGFNVIEKMQMFQNYIVEAQRIPRYTMKENSPHANSSHWSHSMEICLRSELNWTQEEINEAPLSKALADYFGHAEASGTVILLSDDDIAEAIANAARIEEAMMAARN